MAARILGSRITLGLCGVVLVGNAILGRVYQVEQIDTLTAEQECREGIDGALTVGMATALGRVLEGLLEVSEGDEEGLAVVVAETSSELDAYEAAIDARKHAIEICTGG